MSHYFSHVRLLASLRDNDWLQDLARHGDHYRDHALIWKLFPGNGMPRDFVFRRLEDDRSFYVVSARQPQPDTNLFQVHTKPYMPHLQSGEWLRFELRANPTISIRQKQGRSRRHDVLMHAKHSLLPDQRSELTQTLQVAGASWLVERASHWGWAIREDSLLQSGYRQHRLKRKGDSIEFASLDYQGVARVTNPEKFRAVLLDGVGHSKGFGCGLLLVKKI